MTPKGSRLRSQRLKNCRSRARSQRTRGSMWLFLCFDQLQTLLKISLACFNTRQPGDVSVKGKGKSWLAPTTRPQPRGKTPTMVIAMSESTEGAQSTEASKESSHHSGSSPTNEELSYSLPKHVN
ncbi:hypothetical protein GUJ93_ZPchr0007g4930 [Zizania palustris]|uniref:Uncharacterized protein n=1 Tax=Zizania palustris TaxID=103762 RepID=A0A8J5TFC4_ZIZPA|nr:hypothetical protein GUJ93_ZPchr0007g4930 [Zizania palustris]